jgi:hypothetical protein
MTLANPQVNHGIPNKRCGKLRMHKGKLIDWRLAVGGTTTPVWPTDFGLRL